jgi:hypothetical protein
MSEPELYLPLAAGNLKFRWRFLNYELSLDERFLTVTVGVRGSPTTSKTRLSDLLEEFVVDAPVSPAYRYNASRFIYSLLAAVVVQFSRIPAFVPLLAPALFVLALFYSLRCLPHILPVQQTRVLNYYGAQIAAVPHLPELEGARQRFEERLRDAIARVRSYPPIEDKLQVAVERTLAVPEE